MMPAAPQAAASMPPKRPTLRPTHARRRVHDHLPGPQRHCVGHASDRQGIPLFAHHRRLDSRQLPLGLHALSTARRMVRRQDGPRRALAIMVTWWSIFTTPAWSAASMVVVRFVFGIGESGAFPIATRSPLALLALTLIALSLDAPRRTRLRARHRLSPRRRCHSPAGGLDDSA